MIKQTKDEYTRGWDNCKNKIRREIAKLMSHIININRQENLREFARAIDDLWTTRVFDCVKQPTLRDQFRILKKLFEKSRKANTWDAWRKLKQELDKTAPIFMRDEDAGD